MKTKILLLLLFSFSLLMYAQSINTEDDKFHQFDFWLGEWEVYRYGTDQLAGHSYIETIVDSLGLLEHYKAANGKYNGKSLNKYNVITGRWEQFWIDNAGNTLHLSGGLTDGEMVLDDLAKDPKPHEYNRITWHRINDNKVRQTWEISADAGRTWKIIFDGEYRRK